MSPKRPTGNRAEGVGVQISLEDCRFGGEDHSALNNKLSTEEGKGKMKVHCDKEVDAVYIRLGNQKSDGVVEISEGVNLDTTSENRIVGIEILNASKKMNIRTILSYELELDKESIPSTARR